MSDVFCPYCNHEKEINHDDGYGYEEDEKHDQECRKCERVFNFTTCISFDYEVFCNDGDHDLVTPFPVEHPTYTMCNKCDYRSYK